MTGIGILVILVLALLGMMVKIVPEYERAVVFRLGRVLGREKGPGIILLIPLIDRAVKISIRTVTMDVEPQDIITKDNVSLKVNAVVYFRVVNPIRSIIAVENFMYATSQLAQTRLRSTLGEHTLDELLGEREKINAQIQRILDQNTDPWGIKVEAVEIKHVDLPEEMRRAMAREAESERERRAKIIAAEGELQASEKLSMAAKKLEESSITLQLRYLQTLNDISSENNTTVVFPLPIELLRAFEAISGKTAR